jgi:A/G-specific adenine glycosylase
VDQGKSYYLKFASEFPTVQCLAKADSEKVMKLWQGLGYYSRARNLQQAAKMICSDFNGKFPVDFKDILSLKGIGEYTASAIASFAYNQPHAVVDGNVYRVLARVFGIETPIDSNEGKKAFSALASELLNKKDPALHNQAIMEFGALQCKPAPDCSVCPLNSNCFAYAKKKVQHLPFKAKKTKVRDRFFNYVVLNSNGSTIINKRTEKDIWTGLYDFPLIETSAAVNEPDLLISDEWKKVTGGKKFILRSVSPSYKHILSHQKIYARFWEIEFNSDLKKIAAPSAIVIKQKDIQLYAVPRLIENYLESK